MGLLVSLLRVVWHLSAAYAWGCALVGHARCSVDSSSWIQVWQRSARVHSDMQPRQDMSECMHVTV
jgi:hypothetical protein